MSNSHTHRCLVAEWIGMPEGYDLRCVDCGKVHGRAPVGLALSGFVDLRWRQENLYA